MEIRLRKLGLFIASLVKKRLKIREAERVGQGEHSEFNSHRWYLATRRDAQSESEREEDLARLISTSQ